MTVQAVGRVQFCAAQDRGPHFPAGHQRGISSGSRATGLPRLLVSSVRRASLGTSWLSCAGKLPAFHLLAFGVCGTTLGRLRVWADPQAQGQVLSNLAVLCIPFHEGDTRDEGHGARILLL